MITLRPAAERGHTVLDWLDSYHTFSFDQYRDPRHQNFRKLRVMNEDRVIPGAGFGTHPHRDMEILTWVIEGALEHKDSLGTGSVIRPGDIQRMSAGTGVLHSEYNHSKDDPVHFLQIWIFPDKPGHKPGYEQRNFDREALKNGLVLIASGSEDPDAVHLNQDVNIYVSNLSGGEGLSYDLTAGRHVWLQLYRGELNLNGLRMKEGDGAAISNEASLTIEAPKAAEFLLFDLA